MRDAVVIFDFGHRLTWSNGSAASISLRGGSGLDDYFRSEPMWSHSIVPRLTLAVRTSLMWQRRRSYLSVLRPNQLTS